MNQAPWWATLIFPIITLLVGQWLAGRSATNQRDADARDRQAERDHALKMAQQEAQVETERAREQRAADERAERRKQIEAACHDALDSIAWLRAELAHSATADDPKPVSGDCFRHFTASATHVRLFSTNTDTLVDKIAEDLARYVRAWSETDPDSRTITSRNLDVRLGAVVDDIAADFRDLLN